MPTSYIRGAETFGHWMAMGKASVFRHLFVSLFLSLFLAGGLLALSFEDLGASLPEYLLASMGLVALQNSPQASVRTGPKTQALQDKVDALAALFQGRDVVVLLGQLLELTFWLLPWVALLVATLLTLHGRRVAADEHKRGVQFRNLEDERSAVALGRAVAVFCCGFVLLLPVALAVLPGASALGVLDACRLALMDWSPLYRELNTEGQALWLWFEPGQGYYSTVEARRHLARLFPGGGFRELLLVVGVCSVGASIGAGGVSLLLSREDEQAGIVLAGIEVPPGRECQHVVFMGTSGSGKSTQIKLLLEQVRQRGEPAIVFDIKGEFTEHFYREGKDRILNPLDARSSNWDPWSEAQKDRDYDLLANALIPSSDKDPYWGNASRSVFAAACRWCEMNDSKTVGALRRFLSQHPANIYAELCHGGDRTEEAAMHLNEGGTDTRTLSVLANLAAHVGVLKVLEQEKEGDFSVRQFVKESRDSDSWLFVAPSADTIQFLSPLMSLWIQVAVSTALTLPEDGGRLWTVLDEFKALRGIPSLGDLLEQGRAAGNAVVLGFQAVSQVTETYGSDTAQSLLSQPQTWMILRQSQADSAAWASKQLGSEEIEEMRESQSMGADAHRDGVSLGSNSRERALVLPSQLQELADHEAYLKVAGIAGIHHYVPGKMTFASSLGAPRFVEKPERTSEEKEVKKDAVSLDNQE